MENKIQKIDCPICGLRDAKLYGIRNDYHLYKSDNCGVVFVWPIPTQTVALYNKDYFCGAKGGFGYNNYDSDKIPQFKTMHKYLTAIELYIKSGNLLDIGAAQGNFLELAAGRGWRVKGVEISSYATAIARERGIDVLNGTIGDGQFLPRSFDVITMWDVFEHVQNPIADIRRVFELLKPGGIIAINTPDSGSWWARLLGSRWHLIVPPEHLYLFNNVALSRLLSQKGFQVMKTMKIGKSFSAPYVLNMMYRWTGVSLFAKLSQWSEKSFLRHFAIPINLYDNMFVIAQKK